MKKHSTRLAARTANTTIGIGRVKSPKILSRVSIGVKAASVVRPAAKIGLDILNAPRSAAYSGVVPLLNTVAECSPTTIASSTIMPSVIIKVNIDSIFMVRSSGHIKPSVAIMEIGTPSATQKAIRAFKNKNRVMRTRIMPPSPLRSNSPRRWAILSASVS